MPEIQDYRHADCNLFRTPPLDFSKLDSTLIDTLVSSWKNGYTADNALQKVVEDTSLVRELTKQVAEQLTFQRRTELEQLKSEEKA
ncbi:hypothetical protein HYZ97_01610, partial [Candidatus Pacearchaeota archaeon]|nr:hypothetical protein [Candidatus Pacearchaeota archaeon]